MALIFCSAKATPVDESGGNIVHDPGALVRLYDCRVSGAEPATFVLDRPCHLRIVVVPVADSRRGIIERGGRLYPANSWLDGEVITLSAPDGRGLATFQAVRDPGSSRRHDAPSVTLQLEPGEYTLRPSQPFCGSYSLTLIEEP